MTKKLTNDKELLARLILSLMIPTKHHREARALLKGGYSLQEIAMKYGITQRRLLNG